MSDESSTQTVLGISFYPRQWEAVSAPIGPVLVLAGPGAGKTRCLTGRIGYLIDHCHVRPQSICAITFTNKAAKEIHHRLRRTLGDVVEELSTGTIHALCLQLLRNHGEKIGLRKGFGIADDTHQRLILKKLRVPDKRRGGVLNRFGRRLLEGYALSDGEAALHEQYEEILGAQNLIDFNGILFRLKCLLDADAAVLDGLRQRWAHLLVDEFQDLDPFQYAIIRSLAASHRSLFAVGDDEQSIFSFRSADPRLIDALMKDFGIHEPIVLDLNCRCTKAIFEVARRILPPNEFGFEKQISAQRESSIPVAIREFGDETQEAAWIVEALLTDHAVAGLPWGEYALLYRYHTIGDTLEPALIAAGIPCQSGKGRALTDDPMVEEILCALRIILEPDSWLEIERLAKAFLGDFLLAELQRQPGDTLLSQARKFAHNRRDADGKRCWRFIYLVENLRNLGLREGHLRDLISTIVAQGLGRAETPLEANSAELSDPADLPTVKRLGELFVQAEQEAFSILVTPADGLEFPVREMIRQALPKLAVEVWRPGQPAAANSLILVLHDNGSLLSSLSDAIYHWFSETGLCKATQVFKALQYASSSGSARLFDEYVCFDTETTGKDIDHCDIIDLAAVKVWRGGIVETFQTLIFTERPVAPEAAKLHGYTNTDLVGKPTFAEVWPRFRRFIGEQPLVGHNGHFFDVPVIQRLARTWKGLDGLVLFDSLPLARSLIRNGGMKLEDLADRFGVDKGTSHRALDDSRCLAGVFERLISEHERRNRKTCLSNLLDCLALGIAIENPATDVPEEKLLFRVGRWRALASYSNLLDAYAAELSDHRCQGPALEEIVERLGGKDDQKVARKQRGPEDRHPETFARLRTLIEHAQAPTLRESVRKFVDTLALSRSDDGPDLDRVHLLTYHATKGLEFSRVYVVGAEDDQMLGTHLNKPENPEEEREARRLLYVAMTRAKDGLAITHCRQRNGKPTRGVRLVSELR